MHSYLGRPASPPRLRAVLGSAGAVALALAAMTVGSGAGRDAFIAGQVGTRTVTLSAIDRTRALDRAFEVRRALDLPKGAHQAAVRLEDRFEGGLVDEVTTLDTAGRPVAIVRLDPTGGLRAAVRLGWSDAIGHLSAADAAAIATRLATSVGLPRRQAAEASTARSAHGWTIAWPRFDSGAIVRGDGTTVRLWPDAAVHSIARLVSPLAPAPADPLDGLLAVEIVREKLSDWGLSAASTSHPVLAWVAPNDLFEPARPDAPDTVRRLAWVVRVTPTGDVASRLRAIEVHVDAGDGRLLGGDVLE